MNESITKNKISILGYLMPDIGDIIYFVVLYILLYIRPNMLFNDGSTGWHLVTGNYILQNHHIPHVDIMSYTFINKPWIAYEWLSDTLMAILVKLGGLNLLYVVSTSAIAFLILFLYVRCRQNGSNFVFATFITIIGALLSAIHWLARPHLFTFFGVFIFTTLLDKYYRGALSKKKLALFLTAYMLIWANCHPGFILGLAIIAIYLFSAIVKAIMLKSDAGQKNKIKEQITTLSYTLVLNILASLCTPHGFQLYFYIVDYLVKSHAVIAATDEFQSPIFHGAMQPVILEIFFALTILGLIITKSRITLPNFFTYLMFAHLSLSAQRNMALYVIANLPIIAHMYAHTKIDFPTGEIYINLKQIWQNLIVRFQDLNKGFSENEQQYSYHILPILASITLIIIALNSGKVFGYPLLKADFDEAIMPSTTLNTIKELHLDPKHGFSLDNWGGILRYKIDYPVFIDDRADFYGQDFYIDYGKLTLTAPGWQNILKRYQIEWILLPKNSRLIEELKMDSHWQIKAEDKSATLIVKKNADAAKMLPISK